MQWTDTTSPEDFVHTAAQFLSHTMQDAIENQGSCILGLSGGSTPRPIYDALGKDKEIDWSRVWMFLVDERFISSEHPDSNLRLIRETLLQDSGTYEAEHVICPKTDLSYDACIETYDRDLKRLFDDHGHPDIITLGMGDDGHIASLFPPVSAAGFGPSLVIPTTTDRFAVRDRISVTMPVLESAHQRVFLLKGEKKRSTWTDMMESKEDQHRWPAKALLDDRTTVIFGA